MDITDLKPPDLSVQAPTKNSGWRSASSHPGFGEAGSTVTIPASSTDRKVIAEFATITSEPLSLAEPTLFGLAAAFYVRAIKAGYFQIATDLAQLLQDAGVLQMRVV